MFSAESKYNTQLSTVRIMKKVTDFHEAINCNNRVLQWDKE